MKDLVLEHIELQTKEAVQLEDVRFTAAVVAKQFQVSRNLISQYLNEGVKEGILVKTNGRPVYFFSRQVLEERTQCKLDAAYDSVAHLEDAMRKKTELEDFHKLIGHKNSLRTTIDQCKAAICYPPNGLPVLLYGPTGTGKTMIANVMYEYAVHHKLIAADKKFITVNCSEYANNPELITANLFGSKKGSYTGADKDNPGLIQLADGGILFLDEVHCLKAECQEKLFLFMDKGIYHMLGDNENWYQSHVRLIFATTENPEDVLLKTLLRRIPFIVTVPSLEERPLVERKQLVHHLLAAEAKKIQRTVSISNSVYQTLLNGKFAGNIGSLKNIIKAACANAYMQQNNPVDIQIHINHLPPMAMIHLPAFPSRNALPSEETMIGLSDLEKAFHADLDLIVLYQSLMQQVQLFRAASTNEMGFLDLCGAMIDRYQESIMFDSSSSHDDEFQFLRKITDKIFSIIINRYGIRISNNQIFSYAKYFAEYKKYAMDISWWLQNKRTELAELAQFISQKYVWEYKIVNEIANNVKTNLDIELDEIAKLMLTIELRNHSKQLYFNHTLCIILAHGYSTASSIADAANKMLGQVIFDAIDMELDVNVDRIVEKLNQHLQSASAFEELILLVDMGSLEEIDRKIRMVSGCNIGIINNITTKLALQIGQYLKQGKDTMEILDKVTKESMAAYRYINHRQKENVLLSVCTTGVGAAEKFKELLFDSLPKPVPLGIIPYDYHSLVTHGKEDMIFSKYHVLSIIGTRNPNVEGVDYIAIEELILNNHLNQLYQIFKMYLNDEEILQLQANILKNFTLSNVGNHLTILNANKVLEDVEEVVSSLEQALDIKLAATVKAGLYMHLCCLIERLITRNEVLAYEGLDIFIQQRESFIAVMKSCFSVVEKRYSVELPNTEIAYIYNYIQM